MQGRKTYVLQAIAIGGGIASLLTGAYAIAGGATSAEGAVAIVLLIVLSISLGAALGIQAITYGRAARYAQALGQVLRLTGKLHRLSPETMTGLQATEVCDRFVDDLAKILSQICGSPCFVSLEILTPAHPAHSPSLRRATDFVVVNLSRDSTLEAITGQHQRRHSVEGNTAYRQIFEDNNCGAHYICDDVAAESVYTTTELKADALVQLSAGRLKGRRWPLQYRSTLVIKVCQAEPCSTGEEHIPVAFLWLRSPVPGAFHEEFDVELARHVSRGIAPVVTRCVRANKPTHDFRRQPAAVPELARPTTA